MSIPEELDERASRLDDKLQNLLALFLLGELSADLAKARGRVALEEAYEDLIADARRFYGANLQQLNAQTKRLQAILLETLKDFNNVIDGKAEQEQWKTEEALQRRTYLIALTLMYALFAQATVEIAVINKATWLLWETMEDDRVCPICQGFKGLYDPHDPNLPTIPPHPEGRCWWTIIYKHRTYKY